MTKSKNQHVVPHSKKGWAVKKSGAKNVSRTFSTQKDAIAHAKSVAKNNKSELFIHSKTGKIRERNAYGKDNQKYEKTIDPTHCDFCTEIVAKGACVIQSDHFMVIGNRSGYDQEKAKEKKSSHIMIISKRHISRKRQFTKDEILDFWDILIFIEQCYYAHYGCKCEINRGRNTSQKIDFGQSVFHFHHHMIAEDDFIRDGIGEDRVFYDYEVLDQNFKKLIRERWNS